MNELALKFKILQDQYQALKKAKNEEIASLHGKILELESLQVTDDMSLDISAKSINRSRSKSKSKSGVRPEKENQSNLQDDNIGNSDKFQSKKSFTGPEEIRNMSQPSGDSNIWDDLQGNTGNFTNDKGDNPHGDKNLDKFHYQLEDESSIYTPGES